MKKGLFRICLLGVLMLGSQILLAQNIDSDSSMVSFEVSNYAVNTVHGEIKGMRGGLKFDPENLSESFFGVCIDPATLETGIEKRDAHLKSEDFFEVETYPNICFISSSIRKTADGFITKGKLTMHGVSREIEIPFTYSNKVFEGEIEILRLDYNIGSKGSFMVGKLAELKIVCKVK